MMTREQFEKARAVFNIFISGKIFFYFIFLHTCDICVFQQLN